MEEERPYTTFMPESNESNQDSQVQAQTLSRRKLLQRGLGLAAALGTVSQLTRDTAKPSDPAIEANPPHTAASELREFLASEEATQPLNFENAQYLVTLASHVYDSEGSVLTPDVLRDSTYIIRGTPEDQMAFDDLPQEQREGRYGPTVEQLLIDYPELHEYEATHPFLLVYMGYDNVKRDTLAQVHDRKAFLYLHAINKKRGDRDTYRDSVFPSQGQSFDSLEEGVVCRDATPAETIVATSLHEWRHIEAYTDPNPPLDQEVVIARNSVRDNSDMPPITAGEKQGFIMSFESDPQDTSRLNNISVLDEMVVEYLTTKNLLAHNLPATPGYRLGPVELANMQKIFSQAGISDTELDALHRDADLVTFFTKIGDGAEGISFTSQQEKINFSFRLFSKLFTRTGHFDDGPWEASFAPFYPDLNIDYYQNKAAVTSESGYITHPVSCTVDHLATPTPA